MMDHELKAKWVEALRNGNYKQGGNKLRIEDSYCCLDVLCAVSKEGVWDHRYAGDCTPFVYEKQDGFGYLPEAFREKLQLSRDAMQALADMNDEQCASFSEIADYIEANL